MNPVFDASGALEEPLRMLERLRLPDISHLVLAVADDDVVRQEAMAEIGERLSGLYRLEEFDYADAPVASLLRFYRHLSGSEDGPVCLFAHGLDVLKARDSAAYEESLQFLNMHREDLTLAHGAVVLWLTADTWGDVLEQAPDFADWESVGATFALPEGGRIERSALGRLPIREAEDLRLQIRRFREMLARPNLGLALETEFREQLDIAERRLGRVEDLRRDYRLHLTDELREHVLGGFAPRVGGRDLSLPLSKIFLPLRAVEGRPALAEYAEEDLRWQERRSDDDLSELDWRSRREEMEKRHARLHHRQAVQRSFTLEELLKERRAVLLGDPGAGKTTVTRYIAWALAARDYEKVGDAVRERLPVLVRLANYGKALEGNQELTLLDYVASQLMPQTAFGPMLRSAVEAGECLVILDGLDEVTDPDLRGDVTLRIQALVSQNAGNRYLVTSRIVGYDRTSLTHDYQHATLQDLDDDDKKRFVGLWYAAIRSEIHDRDLEAREAELVDALGKKPQIARMGANPLLLTIMVLMHWRGFKLPSRRVQIYQNATDTLIEYWTADRVTLDAEEVKQLLAPVAYYILSSNVGGVIARGDLLSRLREGIVEQRGCDEEEAEGVCDELVMLLSEQSGIFLERGLDVEGQPVYGFLHQTFAEYLAALHLTNLFLDGSFQLKRFIHREAWKESLLLLAGHLSLFSQMHVTRLLRAILDHPCPYEHILRRNVLLAAECLADDIQVAPKVRDEALKKLAEVLFDEAQKPREAAMELYRPIGRSRHRGAAVATVRKVEVAVATSRKESSRMTAQAVALSTAFIRLGERDESSCSLGSIGSPLTLQIEGWPEDAESLLLKAQMIGNLYIQTGPTLKDSYLGSLSAQKIQQLLGVDQFNALLERLAGTTAGAKESAFRWLQTLTTRASSTDSFVELAKQAEDPRIRLLAATHLLETESRAIGLETLKSMNAEGFMKVAEALLEAGEEDSIEWNVVQGVALQPFNDGASQAIRLLLKARRFDAVIPAALLFLLRKSDRCLPIINDLHSAGYVSLAHLIARWLALRPGDDFRIEACEFLVDSGRIEEAILLLQIAAYECHDELSQRACQRLLMLREIEIVVPVLRHLLESPAPDVRYEAALALALVSHSSKPDIDFSRSRLKTAILADRHRRFRQANLELYENGLSLLGQPTDTRSVTALGRLSLVCLFGYGSFREDVDQLSQSTNPSAVDRNLLYFDLIEGVTQRATERWRRSAEIQGEATGLDLRWFYRVMSIACSADALGVLHNSLEASKEAVISALAARRPKGTSHALTRYLATVNPDHDLEAMITLALVAPVETLDRLSQLYENGSSFRRRIAVAAMARSRTPTSDLIIINALSDSDMYVQAEAVRALARLEFLDTGQSLKKILDDPESRVRSEVVLSLGKIADPEILRVVTSTLKDTDANVRSTAVEVLVRLPGSKRTKLLREALEDASPAVRRSAILGLDIDSSITFGDLMANLTHADPGVRVAVAECMGGFVEGISHLLDLLGDESEEIRAAACASLGRQRVAPTAPLTALLNDSDGSTRAEAASALGRLREAATTEHLMTALGDPEVRTRGSAAIALARLGCRDAIRKMIIAAVDVLLNFRRHYGADRIVSALARLNATEALPALVTCAIPNRPYLGALLPLDPQSILDAFDRFEFPLQFYGWPHWLRGHALWRLEGPEAAESAFVEAVDKHATIEHLLTLALFRLEQDDLKDADVCVERAFAKYWETREERALCFLTRAIVTRRRGDLVEALVDVREAVRLDCFVTDLQDLEFDHLWRPSALDIVRELAVYVERDRDDFPLSEVAETPRPYEPAS